jgi:hypothetical protein
MIQRIQSIYLLTASLLIGSLLFLPFIEIVSVNGDIYRFDSGGFYQEGIQNPKVIFESLSIMLLVIVSAIFIFITIFQYNRRTRQIAFSKLNIFIILVVSTIMCYDVNRCVQLTQGNCSLKVYLAFPLISIILIYLAIKAIIKDERLLKSIDRIR